MIAPAKKATTRGAVANKQHSYVSFDRVEKWFGEVDVCARGGIPARLDALHDRLCHSEIEVVFCTGRLEMKRGEKVAGLVCVV